MQPYKPRYNNNSPDLPDIGMVLKNVFMAKKGLINKILAPVIAIKKRLFETKKNLISPLIRPVLSIKKKKLGLLRGLIDTKSSLLDSVGQMLGGSRGGGGRMRGGYWTKTGGMMGYRGQTMMRSRRI